MKNYSRKSEWDKSFEKGDNNILYPQTEVVRFLNRYITKRNNNLTNTNLIHPKNRILRGLDFACGVGTHSLLLNDFGIESFGVDISKKAISLARKNALRRSHDFCKTSFSVINNDKQILRFENDFFDFVIAESCLDSMPFSFAKRYFQELKRICNKYIYISLISKEVQTSNDDEIVIQGEHEKGTVQSYYDEEKIEDLIEIKIDFLKYFILKKSIDPTTQAVNSSRYYLVINKNVYT